MVVVATCFVSSAIVAPARADGQDPPAATREPANRPPPALVHRSPGLMYAGLGLGAAGLGTTIGGAISGTDELVIGGVTAMVLGVTLMIYGEKKVPPSAVSRAPALLVGRNRASLRW